MIHLPIFLSLNKQFCFKVSLARYVLSDILQDRKINIIALCYMYVSTI